jgi:hypothetical protein
MWYESGARSSQNTEVNDVSQTQLAGGAHGFGSGHPTGHLVWPICKRAECGCHTHSVSSDGYAQAPVSNPCSSHSHSEASYVDPTAAHGYTGAPYAHTGAADGHSRTRGHRYPYRADSAEDCLCRRRR